MTRRDWLLLLVGLDERADGLEPVRVQKGLFLLAREGGLPPRERYWFVPYNYGPMSPRVYRDVEALVAAGELERLPVPGFSWGRVRATARGREHARALAGEADPRRLRALEAIRAEVTSLGFADLVEAIYARYPEFRAASVFRRR